MSSKAAAHLLIEGRVQGVGYRYFAQEAATALGLMGWVRNLPDRGVESYVEGPRSNIEAFVHELQKGPPMAHVAAVRVEWQEPADKHKSFSIIS